MICVHCGRNWSVELSQVTVVFSYDIGSSITVCICDVLIEDSLLLGYVTVALSRQLLVLQRYVVPSAMVERSKKNARHRELLTQ